MSIRDERLTNDCRSLQKLCAFNEPVKIKILEKRGKPPDYYRIKFSNCKGVESVTGNTPKYRTEHIIVVSNFPSNYPDAGELPNVKMETPIYHPNVYPGGNFCFQGRDLKILNQPLDVLVKRIITMIQYENLNFGSPANTDAKIWAEKNKNLFPLSVNSTISPSKLSLTWR